MCIRDSTWAEIDLRRLEHNYNEIRRVLPPGCRFAGLCKANAYGHGAVTVAKRLEALGADCIAVSCCEEAAELRLSLIHICVDMLRGLKDECAVHTHKEQ